MANPNADVRAGSADRSAGKQSLFVTGDGRNLMFTFILVSSLFLLWGLCNGMIDAMDKHFQDELGLSKSQSAWVQFAHYLGYFLMAMPAGWLAIKLGYKGGIIAGLLMVAAGGFWFWPATYVNEMAKAGTVTPSTAFVAYLAGVCAIAAGLTFLETIANPYTTVLGPKRYAATRINLAQSCNGVGWILGPVLGGIFFYSTDAAGKSTGSETLYIPYVVVGGVVLALAVIFYFASVPDIKAEDDYHLDDQGETTADLASAQRKVSRGQVYVFSVLNAAVLVGITGMILWLIGSALKLGDLLVGFASQLPHPGVAEVIADNALLIVVGNAAVLLTAVAALLLIPGAMKMSHHSIWSHPHFSAATLAQFLYVAAQAGIFSFFINYMTEEVPALPAWVKFDLIQSWFTTSDSGVLAISPRGASSLLTVGFICFLTGRFTGAVLLKKYSAHKILGLYGVMNVAACVLVYLKLGWLSVACVFASFFFMSIMFPTIFALGIFGLGAQAKKASAYLVMAIMGGAVLPKLMGYVADHHGMSRGFIVPAACFAFVAFYGFVWSKLSQAESLHGVSASGGH